MSARHAERLRRPSRLCFGTLLLAGCVGSGTLQGPVFHGAGPFYAAGESELSVLRSDPPVHRLLLVGDAGAPRPQDPTLALVSAWTAEMPERSTTLFLGDNLYPAGLRESDRARGEAVLRQQIASSRGLKIFLPGNHDWGASGRQRLAPGRVAAQQRFIDSQAAEGAVFLPKKGCPGPRLVELLPSGEGLEGGLAVVAVDLHWWLLDEVDRPVCWGVRQTSAFVARLREMLDSERERNLIVASHHPLRSGGPHGGLSRGFWTDLGVALAYRFFTIQDLLEPNYAQMAGVLSKVLAEHPPLATVAGHDHSLQILDGGRSSQLAIVSGAATIVSDVTAIEGTMFAHAHRGFVVLDFHGAAPPHSEVVIAHVVETGKGKHPVFSRAFPLVDEPQSVAAPTSRTSMGD